MHIGKTNTLKAVAAAAAAMLLLTACGGGDNKKSSSGAAQAELGKKLPELKSFKGPDNPVLPAGDGKAVCSPDTTLALIAVLNGPYANLGRVQENAVRLAVEQHNSSNPNCQVQLKVFDTEGSPDKAPGVVTQAAADSNIIGVVGLGFSGTSQAAGSILVEAGLPNITFASRPSLSQNGWKTFHRGIANDDFQAPAVAKFLVDTLKVKKVYVVNDDSTYGQGAGTLVKENLGSALVGSDKIVSASAKDYSTTVSKAMRSGAEAIFYGGYYDEASALFTQLRNNGFKGVLIGADGIKDEQLIKQAAAAAENVYMSCACVDGSLIPDFNKAYRERNKEAPGTFSADAYDMTTVLLSGIDKGVDSREKMQEWLQKYDADGITKHYKWDDKGELEDNKIFFYRVEKGKIIPVA